MKKLIIVILGLLIGFVCFVQADYDQTIVATTLILEAGGEYYEGSLEVWLGSNSLVGMIKTSWRISKKHLTTLVGMKL